MIYEIFSRVDDRWEYEGIKHDLHAANESIEDMLRKFYRREWFIAHVQSDETLPSHMSEFIRCAYMEDGIKMDMITAEPTPDHMVRKLSS